MVEYHQMLTTSLPPVTLISGVGLLLLAMTARYNHSTNRVRQLLRERNSIAPRENQDLNHEIDLIFERASLLRMSILTVVLSATFSGLQVLAGILECLFMLNLDVLKLGALILSISFLLISTIYFVKEVSLSTKAIGLSVEPLSDKYRRLIFSDFNRRHQTIEAAVPRKSTQLNHYRLSDQQPNIRDQKSNRLPHKH